MAKQGAANSHLEETCSYLVPRAWTWLKISNMPTRKSQLPATAGPSNPPTRDGSFNLLARAREEADTQPSNNRAISSPPSLPSSGGKRQLARGGEGKQGQRCVPAHAAHSGAKTLKPGDFNSRGHTQVQSTLTAPTSLFLLEPPI